MKSTFKQKDGNKFKPKIKVKKEVNEVDEDINYRSEIPDVESDSEDEINYLAKEFGKVKQKEIDYYKKVVNGNYYFTVYFADTEQMNDFIEKAKIKDLFDETNLYLAGKDLADKLNIPIIQKQIKRQGYFKQGKKFDIKNF